MTGTQIWQVLSGLPAWQVTEIPRPPAGQDGRDGTGDGGALERALALTSAYGCGTPVAVAWLRDRASGPVRVLVAGPGLAGGADAGQTVLTVSPGARAVPLPDGEIADTLAVLPCWSRIGGVSDALLAGDSPDTRVPVPSLETGLLTAWLDAFAWLVVAEPVPGKDINDLAFEAAHAQLTAEGFAGPRSKLAARRAAARHEELRQAVTAGLWRVHLLAAGTSQASAARVARLVCASAGLHGLPYALSARETCGPLPDTLAMVDVPRPAQHQAPPPAAEPAAAERSWWDTPMNQQQPRSQWPAAGYADDPALAARLADDERDTPVPQSPFTASTRLLAALARPPSREVPGLLFTLRPAFDVTPEHTIRHAGMDGPQVAVGAVLDGNRMPAGTLTLPVASLNRHMLVCGATGSGKSQTIRALLEQAAHVGLPWLVIEPAKAEYRLMAARLPGTTVIRIRPGDVDQPPAGINPLEPSAGPDGTRFPLQTHADLLRALFLAAFQADEPFPQVLAAALTRCYENAGWDLVTGQPVKRGLQLAYPGLQDLQSAALAVVDEIGYGREVRDNVRGFVTVRIGSLRLGTTGRFLDGGHPINFTALLSSNAVFEIEDAGDDRDKAFLMGAVLVRLTEHLRIHHRPGHPAVLRHLTVVEEAHRLLRQPPAGTGNGPAAQAVEMFADLLAEVRAYGEGLIIAEQIPAKLIPDVVKNTAVKIVHRLPAEDDRAAVGATMNLQDDQSAYLVTLVPGEAAVFTDGMDYPVLARIPDGTRTETGPAQVASPAAVITSRSNSCGPDCQGLPCTLRDMRAAQHALTACPPVVLWAEYSVISHLTGSHMPTPTTGLENLLAGLPRRLRDCATGLAVDAAVASRAAAISSRVSPAALAEHVTRAIRAALDGELLCDGDQDGLEPQWLAPPYRWAIVLDDLAEFHRRDEHAGPHPDTSRWEAVYGQQIPGDTCAAQLEMVNRWYKSDINDASRCWDVILGSRVPSAIETAMGARYGEPRWNQRLADSLDWFDDLHFPLKYLTSDAGGSAAEGQA